MPSLHQFHARGKENCPPGCDGSFVGGGCGCAKPVHRTNDEKCRTVYDADPEIRACPKEYMQGTRYVARIEYLEHLGMCIPRRDMRRTNGNPRFVQCVICGMMLDLGPIRKGITVFLDHFELRHVPEDVYLVESEEEEDNQEDENSFDDEEVPHNQDEGEDEELADEED